MGMDAQKMENTAKGLVRQPLDRVPKKRKNFPTVEIFAPSLCSLVPRLCLGTPWPFAQTRFFSTLSVRLPINVAVFSSLT